MKETNQIDDNSEIINENDEIVEEVGTDDNESAEEVAEENEEIKDTSDKNITKKTSPLVRIIRCIVIPIAIIAVIIGGFYVFQNHLCVMVELQGDCMKPNIKNGETIIASRLIKPENIKRNDVIVFQKSSRPNQYFMRRVLGLPGEEVTMKNGNIYINDKKIKDPYRGKNSMFGIMEQDSIKLGKNEFFVLCDYRPNIDDSRMSDMGPIKAKEIIGVKRAE